VTVALVLLGSVSTPARVARADVCVSGLADWEVARGRLFAAESCGAFYATATPLQSTFAYGDFGYRTSVRLPFDMGVTWRRLGPDSHRPLELRILGGLLLFKDGAYGLYLHDDARFQGKDGWRELAGFRTHDVHTVLVHQTEASVSLTIDGKLVDLWSYRSPIKTGRVGLAMKAAAGYQSLVWFKNFRPASQ